MRTRVFGAILLAGLLAVPFGVWGQAAGGSPAVFLIVVTDTDATRSVKTGTGFFGFRWDSAHGKPRGIGGRAQPGQAARRSLMIPLCRCRASTVFTCGAVTWPRSDFARGRISHHPRWCALVADARRSAHPGSDGAYRRASGVLSTSSGQGDGWRRCRGGHWVRRREFIDDAVSRLRHGAVRRVGAGQSAGRRA